MGLVLIAAYALDSEGRMVIGKDGKMPWPKNREDLNHFKQHTLGYPVIMGRRTFESIGSRPLPERLNIVFSSQLPFHMGDDLCVFSSFNMVLGYAANKRETQFIIGGQRLYELGIGLADSIELTRIKTSEFVEGDTYFPVIDSEKWSLKSEVEGETCTFYSYVKNGSSGRRLLLR